MQKQFFSGVPYRGEGILATVVKFFIHYTVVILISQCRFETSATKINVITSSGLPVDSS